MPGVALALLLALATVSGLTVRRQVVEQQVEQHKAAEAARLADLLINADQTQFTANFPKLKELGERGLPALLNEIDQRLPADATEDLKEGLAKRQANAAVVLLRMNQPAKVWPLLKHGPGQGSDPRLRSYLIDRLGPLGPMPNPLSSG